MTPRSPSEPKPTQVHTGWGQEGPYNYCTRKCASTFMASLPESTAVTIPLSPDANHCFCSSSLICSLNRVTGKLRDGRCLQNSAARKTWSGVRPSQPTLRLVKLPWNCILKLSFYSCFTNASSTYQKFRNLAVPLTWDARKALYKAWKEPPQLSQEQVQHTVSWPEHLTLITSNSSCIPQFWTLIPMVIL